MIRKAKMQDIKFIHKILSDFASRSLLLPRSFSELYDHLRDFYIVDNIEENKGLSGVCSLNISWENLGEIRSLAVLEEERGKGFGSGLIKACLSEAAELGLKKVFVLTTITDFFAGFGFKEIKKALLPHKIWAGCIKCPKFPDCDEIAMIIDL